MYDGLSTAGSVLPLDFWKIIDAHRKHDIHLKHDVIHRGHKSNKLINDHSYATPLTFAVNLPSREDNARKFDNLAKLLAMNGSGRVEMALHVKNATSTLPRTVMNALRLTREWLDTQEAEWVLFGQTVDYDLRGESCEKSLEEEEMEIWTKTNLYEFLKDVEAKYP